MIPPVVYFANSVFPRNISTGSLTFSAICNANILLCFYYKQNALIKFVVANCRYLKKSLWGSFFFELLRIMKSLTLLGTHTQSHKFTFQDCDASLRYLQRNVTIVTSQFIRCFPQSPRRVHVRSNLNRALRIISAYLQFM